MTTLEELNDKLNSLAILRLDVQNRESQLEVIKTQAEKVKNEIETALKENNLPGFKNARLNFTLATRHSIKITNPAEVLQWLALNNFNTDDYVSVDSARTKPILEAAWKQNGEIVPGTEAVETISPRITEVKPKAGEVRDL